MEKKRLVVWGGFEQYEVYRPVFRLEEWKGNIEIVGIIFLDEGIIKQVDGYPVIVVEELLRLPFDYVIGLGNALQEDMIKILNVLKIPREKFLAGRIFELPDFDFADYLRVRESRVSIISDTCWGGYTYHGLDMPFLSPFINMFVKEGHFGKLTQNLSQYLRLPLEYMKSDEDVNTKKIYPVCCLKDVEIHCNHYENYEQVKAIWDVRRQRVNDQNFFVKMTIKTEDELEEFRKIPYRKIGFSMLPAYDAEIIDCSGMLDYIDGKYMGFWDFVNVQAKSDRADLKHYNILKLLLGTEDFRRTK